MGNNIRFCLVVALIFAAGLVSYTIADDVITTIALDDGPALFGTSQMPELNPTQETPDSPVKSNVEEPAEPQSDLPKTGEQKESVSEVEPATPVDNSVAKPEVDTQTKSESAVVEPPKVIKRELSPAMVALRDKVRRTLAAYQKMPFNTRQNTADEIINYCMALGCNTEISLFDRGGEKRANGITCLCWNYPCAGYEPLTTVDGHISARLGYGASISAIAAFSSIGPRPSAIVLSNACR